MADITSDPPVTAKAPKRSHTVLLFLAFQLPLLVLLCWLGPCALWRTAEYNLVGITTWCVLRCYVWKDSANCMACSLFCTFIVWTIHVALETLPLATIASVDMKILLAQL